MGRSLSYESLEDKRMLSATPGDFNEDGAVNAADYSVWRDGLGTTYTQSDYDVWIDNYGTVATSDTTTVELQGDSITVDGAGATAVGSVLTITEAGVYRISGTLADGQIIVNAGDNDSVTIILDEVDITSSDNSPIYVANADSVTITLEADTENYLTDGATYDLGGATEPDAALFSNDDLTINGTGSLTVTANYDKGIASDDDLTIESGVITVDAAGHGIKGKDSVVIEGGTLTIKAGGDGIQSDNTENAEKGYVAISGGTVNIISDGDGVQAETTLLVMGGDFTITTGGGSSSLVAEDGSAKGLKSAGVLTINDGTFVIDAAEDAIHSDDAVTINGGTFTIAAADDGVHGDNTVTINGGDIDITTSYEGIESALITINDGTIHVVSSDDGINAAGGVDDSGGTIGGRPGPGDSNSTGTLAIHGGYVYVDSGGDGIDVNGSITMTAGTVIVNGPTANNNGPLDFDGTFTMTGGFLVAVGSAGMAQAPSASSTQESALLTYSVAQAAGTMVHIESEDGDVLLTFVPTKAYQSIAISSPDLTVGESYDVYSGGSSTGAVEDGLYLGGVYTPGTLLGSFTPT